MIGYTSPSQVTTVFEYDLVGNREAVTDTLNGITRTYTPNVANEYTQIAADGVNQGVLYDVRGNLSRDDGFDDDSDDRFEYSYDLENRLTEVGYDDDGDGQNPLTVVAEYRYDANGRRIEYIDHTRSLTTRYYYDGQNVILETDESDDTQRAYVNGPQYIDERGVMRCYEAGEIQDHYYLLAELYTVAGLADCRGWLEEVAVYDTYGDADIRAWPPGDISNRDGTTGWEDSGLIWSMQDAGEFDPLCDADFDGDVDMDDVYAVVAIVNNPAINQAVETTYSALDNPYFFTGRTTDTLHADDLLVANDPDGTGRPGRLCWSGGFLSLSLRRKGAAWRAVARSNSSMRRRSWGTSCSSS